MKKIADKLSFSRLLMLSYIALLSIILIIGITLYNVSYEQVKYGINEQNRLSLSSAVSMLDKSLEVMNVTVRQISSSSTINKLTSLTGNEEPDFFYTGYLAQRDIKSIIPLSICRNQTTYFPP